MFYERSRSTDGWTSAFTHSTQHTIPLPLFTRLRMSLKRKSFNGRDDRHGLSKTRRCDDDGQLDTGKQNKTRKKYQATLTPADDVVIIEDEPTTHGSSPGSGAGAGAGAGSRLCPMLTFGTGPTPQDPRLGMVSPRSSATSSSLGLTLHLNKRSPFESWSKAFLGTHELEHVRYVQKSLCAASASKIDSRMVTAFFIAMAAAMMDLDDIDTFFDISEFDMFMDNIVQQILPGETISLTDKFRKAAKNLFDVVRSRAKFSAIQLDKSQSLFRRTSDKTIRQLLLKQPQLSVNRIKVGGNFLFRGTTPSVCRALATGKCLIPMFFLTAKDGSQILSRQNVNDKPRPFQLPSREIRWLPRSDDNIMEKKAAMEMVRELRSFSHAVAEQRHIMKEKARIHAVAEKERLREQKAIDRATFRIKKQMQRAAAKKKQQAEKEEQQRAENLRKQRAGELRKQLTSEQKPFLLSIRSYTMKIARAELALTKSIPARIRFDKAFLGVVESQDNTEWDVTSDELSEEVQRLRLSISSWETKESQMRDKLAELQEARSQLEEKRDALRALFDQRIDNVLNELN